MLYHLLYGLRDYFSPFNVLRYITFRAAFAFITALVINFLIAPYIIRRLKESKKLQAINTDAPARHMEKQGTPTMGGIIIIISLLISVLLWARLDNSYVLMLIGSSLWLCALGFIDDYKKVSGNPKGVSPSFKLFWQVLLGIIIAAYFYINPSYPAHPYGISLPFLKDVFLNLGTMYILFVMITVVATSNAVNITDGLDGLAIGGIIFASLTYALLSYIAGNVKFTDYLYLPYVTGAGEISVFLAALSGAALGFLWFNIFPAAVFMGDTASLFMGGILGISAIIIKQEILLLIIGGVFLAEILSVIIQIVFFRFSGKRVFRMAPLHHHFELKGWSETQVVVRFWIVAIILSFIAIASLKLR